LRVSIDNIHLDPNNPRLPEDSQGKSGKELLSLHSTPLGILFQFDGPQVDFRIRQTQSLNKLCLKLG
jgi:hypothetical protein